MATARALDNDAWWPEVKDEWIEAMPSAVSFLDADGFRYYLRALLSWSIRRGLPSDCAADDNLLSNLRDDDRRAELLPLLSAEQRDAVCSFLRHQLRVRRAPHDVICRPVRDLMPVAPEPFRSACLEVIYMATLEAPALAWGNRRLARRLSKRRHEQAADLMDAIHNIPHLLNDWDRCDQQWLRQSLLAYDEKWAASGGVKLSEVYDRELARQP